MAQKWKYVKNELDTEYCQNLPDNKFLNSEYLPIAEFTVRKCITSWLIEKFTPFNSLDRLDKIINKKDWLRAKKELDDANMELKKLLSEPTSLAAFQRILSVMPAHVPQKTPLLNILNEELINDF